MQPENGNTSTVLFCFQSIMYGTVLFYSLDECCKISKSSFHKSVEAFTKHLEDVFGDRFLNRFKLMINVKAFQS